MNDIFVWQFPRRPSIAQSGQGLRDRAVGLHAESMVERDGQVRELAEQPVCFAGMLVADLQVDGDAVVEGRLPKRPDARVVESAARRGRGRVRCGAHEFHSPGHIAPTIRGCEDHSDPRCRFRQSNRDEPWMRRK